MENIQAAYNFVPIKKEGETFQPKWAGNVSIDVPIDGDNSYTGTIEYQIKAHTPIFVRGNDGNFTNINGKYFIPGSTLKGCFRTVLEILSYGHMRNRVNDEHFPFRDLQNAGYKDTMKDVYCGWLDLKKRTISDFGKPRQIKYHDLPDIITDKDTSFNKKSAIEKYKKYGYVSNTFEKYTVNSDIKFRNNNKSKTRSRNFCRCKANGQKGYIVFSGTMKNKKTDFVLLDCDLNNNIRTLNVAPNALDSFKTCYPEYKNMPQEDGRILVFFTTNEGVVKTIGLCYNHKYIAQEGNQEAIPGWLKTNEPDLADVMFGYVNAESNKDNALKGRIQFQPAFCGSSNPIYLEKPILTVLGSPHPSFYPNYLQGQNTWDSTAALIAGYKRYPIKEQLGTAPFPLEISNQENLKAKFPKEDLKKGFNEFKVGNTPLIPRTKGKEKKKGEKDIEKFDTISLLKPLSKGTTFSGKVVFFNLKKEELGALLCAMTFDNHEKECYHSIGSAKAMGFGSVEISGVSVNLREIPGKSNKISQKDALEAFRNMMKGHNANWGEKDLRYQELIEMAKDHTDPRILTQLAPPQLDQFAGWKKDWNKGKASLPHFTKLVPQKKK